MRFKPSLYQLFLTSITILIIVLLLFQNALISPGENSELKIGIIDSGCSINQKTQVAEFKTFTTTENGYSYDDTSFYDTVDHGRYVCEIIIDGTNNVDIYSAKIANSNGQVTYDGLFAAVKYLVEDKGVDIINLSLGGEPYISQDLLEAFEQYANSTIFIAAIGNNARDYTYPEGFIDWPANLPWVIGVGAAENNVRESYSSFGRDVNGLFSTDFSEDGSTNTGKSGTSFATPRVTVAFANLWLDFIEQDKEITPEILHYLLSTSANNKYDNEIGWGVPNPNKTSTDNGIRISGIQEKDPFLRFSGETWQRKWKIVSNLEDFELQLAGNGTENIQNTIMDSYNWGRIYTVNFNGSSPGNYLLNITHDLSNSISYQFNISSSPSRGKILFDHRNTVNGFAHSYGEYYRIETLLRSLRMEVDQIQIGKANLDEYKAVFVTEFGRNIQIDRTFGREFNRTLVKEYTSYVREGGNIQFSLTKPSEFNNDFAPSLENFGVNVSNYKIPDSDNDIAYTSNLTDSVLFNGVISIGASGSGLYAINSSQSVLGYYKSAATSIGTTTKYLGIGIKTTLGSGTIIVWSGSEMMVNDYLKITSDHFDQYLENYFDTIVFSA